MPLYEYHCLPKGHRFEVRHGINEEPALTCPTCGAEVRRVIHPVGIVFKGTGFYATDSRKSPEKPKAASGSKEEAGAAKSEEKGDGKSETKSNSKPESGNGQ